MTVKQLIAKLQRVNPDNLVVYVDVGDDLTFDDEDPIYDICDIEVIKVDGKPAIRLIGE